ncbi:MAG: hypothetical protein AAF517_11045, partial [Planctomycetota bacterium]
DPDIRSISGPGGGLQIVQSGVDVSEPSNDLNDWRADGSATMVGTPGTQSAWLAWVRYEEGFLEYRGMEERLFQCEGVIDCPEGRYEARSVPNIQPNMDSTAIYVNQLTYTKGDGVAPVAGFTPTSISVPGINSEPKMAALPAGDLVTCVWVHDGQNDNLLDDNRGRNVHFASWDSSTSSWTPPVEVVDSALLDTMPGILKPEIVVRRRKSGDVDGLIAFTALPEGADPADAGLGGLRYLYLVRFNRLGDGSFQFGDPVRLRGACDEPIYTWEFSITFPLPDLVDPTDEIFRIGADYAVALNRRGVPGTLASSGDVLVSVLGRGQNEWTAPVCVSDGTRRISNLNASVAPDGSLRTLFLDGGAARTPRGFVAAIAGGVDPQPQGVQSIDTPLSHDLRVASCKLSQQFPGPGARVRGQVRVENSGFSSSGMDSKTSEVLAQVEIVYIPSHGRERVVQRRSLPLLHPGDSETIDFTIEMPLDPVELEARIVSNAGDFNPQNDAQRCDFGAPAPASVTCRAGCSQFKPRVIVEWDNPVAYEEILVYRDGLLVTSLPGAFERFVDNEPGDGARRYEIRGCVGASDSVRSDCTIEVPECPDVPPAEQFRRGDTNSDGDVNISDPTSTLSYLFGRGSIPLCRDAADANDSGAIDISDAVFTLNWLFLGGALPPAPGPFECGADPSDDDATCEVVPESCS